MARTSEPLTIQEILLVQALNALPISGPTEAIQKTGAASFSNIDVGTGSVSITSDAFVTTGGAQTVPLSFTPITVIMVEVNGQILTTAAGDYTIVGSNLNLLNVDVPAGLFGSLAYTH